MAVQKEEVNDDQDVRLLMKFTWPVLSSPAPRLSQIVPWDRLTGPASKTDK